MPLSRPGLPPVYHEGEKRPPMSINRRATGDLPTEVTGQVLPAGTSVAPVTKQAVKDVGAVDLKPSGTQILPGSTSPPPKVNAPNPNPTPQSPPDHQDASGDKHWRKKQARLERERLAAEAAAGQNASADPLMT